MFLRVPTFSPSPFPQREPSKSPTSHPSIPPSFIDSTANITDSSPSSNSEESKSFRGVCLLAIFYRNRNNANSLSNAMVSAAVGFNTFSFTSYMSSLFNLRTYIVAYICQAAVVYGKTISFKILLTSSLMTRFYDSPYDSPLLLC